jgi:hypothetical protein
MKAKGLLKIILTNWIHLPGFYITTYLSLIFFKLIGIETTDSWHSILLVSIFTILLLFMIYGPLIILGFFGAIMLMDILAFSWANKWPKKILIIEWVIISVPFIYWAFEHEYWLWITLSLSLLTTQLMRLKRIKEIESKALDNVFHEVN